MIHPFTLLTSFEHLFYSKQISLRNIKLTYSGTCLTCRCILFLLRGLHANIFPTESESLQWYMFDTYVYIFFLLRGLHFECQRLAYLQKFNKLLHAYIFPKVTTFEHKGYFVYIEFKMQLNTFLDTLYKG